MIWISLFGCPGTPTPDHLSIMACRREAQPFFNAELAGLRDGDEEANLYCQTEATFSCLERAFWVLDHREQSATAQNTNFDEAVERCLVFDQGACLQESFQAASEDTTDEDAVANAIADCTPEDR